MLSNGQIKAAMNRIDAEEYRALTSKPDNQCFDQEYYDKLLAEGAMFNREIFTYGIGYLQAISQITEQMVLAEVREKLEAIWKRFGVNSTS